MEPLIVLVLVPVLIGVVAELVLRDKIRASLAAGLVAPLAVYVWISVRDPGGAWNGLAAFLVAPLTIAFALAAVIVCFGRPALRRHDAGGINPARGAR